MNPRDRKKGRRTLEVRSETPEQRVRYLEPQDVRPKQSERSGESETGRRAVKTMTRDESASLVAV